MQLCPLSYAIGCAKCPIVNVCPGKNIIGNANKQEEEKEKGKNTNEK